MDELCKKLTIQIPLQNVNTEYLSNFENILKAKKGKQSLNFTIWDSDEKIELSVPSRNTKVKITNELLTALEKSHVSYKLN